MKALSARAPHAQALVAGAKTIEWRDWATVHRGPLLIHESSIGGRGAIVGRVRLDAIERVDGRCAWHVSSPVAFARPIPCRGRLGVFEVPDDVVRRPGSGAAAETRVPADSLGRPPIDHRHGSTSVRSRRRSTAC